MSMNLVEAETLRRRRKRTPSLSGRPGATNLLPSHPTRSGLSLCIGQTMELMRRIILIHCIRGPTFLFAIILSTLLIGSAGFWPTVGLQVISSTASALSGYRSISTKFPVDMKWLVGFDGPENNTELIKTAKRLLKHLSSVQRTQADRHWCGPFVDCARHVYKAIDPSQLTDLYPINRHYAFVVQQRHENFYGYMTYLPYETFFSPPVATDVFLPMKQKVDEFFMEEHRMNNGSRFNTRLNIGVAAFKRYIFAESVKRWSNEKTGKLFIITVMAAHQYLSQACIIVCFSSIMCLDKENGFRQLLALMGMRRLSYFSAHFILSQLGVMIVALVGTLIHYTLGPDLTDLSLRFSDYAQMFGVNVIASWHQFGLGIILCSLAKSTRTVLFPLLAIYACLVLVQLVMVSNVLEKVIWGHESSIDNHGYLLLSYAHSSMHIQILTGAMITGKTSRLIFYRNIQFLIALLFGGIGAYLDCVMNTGTGHKFTWDFPFIFLKKCVRSCSSSNEPDSQPYMLQLKPKGTTIDRFVEDGKRQFTRVWMKDVSKDYVRWRGFKKSTFRAVSNVDMSLQKGEITAILGHNGAGKTTIFNILAGLQPASSGDIRIFGQNPLNAWDAISLRKITGICTQFDVLDERLTPSEHMRLMGAIKGLNSTASAAEAGRLFEQLELECYADMASNLLPGGDKRKLSVAMSLIGSPRLIMLDEPTSGVDPFSRRCIWRALRDYRPNRVIVLITHYMDEADILADRKAIMIGGRLVCYGTSRFLKENYNPGYMLYVTCLPKCNTTKRLTDYLCNEILGVSLIRSFSDQLTFFVKPNAIQQLSERVFSQRGQQELKMCCVSSFGFAVTTLEEIFLKLGAEPLDTDAYDASLLQEQLDFQAKSNALERLKRIKPALSLRSGRERPSIQSNLSIPLTNTGPRTEFQVGIRQFGILIRVLLGLLMLPTPLYLLLRTFLPIIIIAISAVIYHVETTTMPTDIIRQQADFISRGTVNRVRQYISIAYPVDSSGNWSDVADQSLFDRDLFCLRRLLGPQEPYVIMLPFDKSTSPTGFSEDAAFKNYDYQRRGSTRFDIAEWNSKRINVTIILGRNDEALTQQLIFFHFALWNCMHAQNLRIQTRLAAEEPNYHWVGEFASWESIWPESHPQLKMGTAVIYQIACGVANCILCPLIAGDIVREKELGILTQLHLYGMKHWAYWGAHFFTHIFQYLMLSSFTTIVMFPFEDHILSSWQLVVLHNWINLLSALDNIVMIYLCCLFFQKAGGAVVLFGSTIMIVIFVNITLFFIPLEKLEASYGMILFLFPFADPHMCLLLTDFRIRLEKVFLFNSTKAHYTPSLWRLLKYNHVKISQITHGLRIILMASAFIGSNVYTHYVRPKRKEKQYYKVMERLQPLSDVTVEQLPPSVQSTTQKVLDFVRVRSKLKDPKYSNVVAFAYHLTKVYFLGSMSILSRMCSFRSHNDPSDDNTKVAITDISFLVNRGEIMGVLGPSGAGKSTLIECLATVVQQDRGQAGVVNNQTDELIPNPTAVEQGAIGFCPQHNPIWPQLTVREHLVIYSVMRDLNQQVIASHVADLMQLVNLEVYRDTYAGSLSGGCKRRLSMAIGLVGDPSLVIMDEPSCGVDPRSRRNLWKTLLKCFRGTRRGCVLTTHFIDEGESLCDQLAILVNGCMLGIGTPLRLKQSCGGGFMIELKMSRDYSLMPDEADTEVQTSLRVFLRDFKKRFPLVKLVDKFEDRVSLQFPSTNMEFFSVAFNVLLDAHKNGAIEDFTISSPTLEQVYFDLAKTQLHTGIN